MAVKLRHTCYSDGRHTFTFQHKPPRRSRLLSIAVHLRGGGGACAVWRWSLNHNGRYILDDAGAPQPCLDLVKWAKWYEGANRVLLKSCAKGVCVSTVFLGIDHAMRSDDIAPILWESMVFGGEHEGEMRRYSSAEDARKGHDEMCKAYLPAQGGVS